MQQCSHRTYYLRAAARRAQKTRPAGPFTNQVGDKPMISEPFVSACCGIGGFRKREVLAKELIALCFAGPGTASQAVRFGFVSLFIILSGDWVSSFGPVLDQPAI